MHDKPSTQETSYRTLQLMSELERDESITQRELAGRLGIAVGLVNSYLKNLASKGFLRIKNYPRNRYSYLLTPKGFAEKTRLAYQHLNYFNDLYTIVRRDYLVLFQQLKDKGVNSIVFCGVDEVAEIAYLSLKETGLTLEAVMDDHEARAGELFGSPVIDLTSGVNVATGPIVLTSLKRSEALISHLLSLGVVRERIVCVHG